MRRVDIQSDSIRFNSIFQEQVCPLRSVETECRIPILCTHSQLCPGPRLVHAGIRNDCGNNRTLLSLA